MHTGLEENPAWSLTSREMAFDWSSPKSREIAWIAGLICGEGSWGIFRPNRYRTKKTAGVYLSFSMGMYDISAMERFRKVASSLLGCELKLIHVHPKGNPNIVYRVAFMGTKANQFAQMIYPLLRGTEKGDQLEAKCLEAGVKLWT